MPGNGLRFMAAVHIIEAVRDAAAVDTVAPRRSSCRHCACGFTLVELLVALSILAVMALMSWRGVDAMLRSDEALQAQAREVRVMDVALSQWHTDLDALVHLPPLPSMAWDGRVLRLLRRDAGSAQAGVTVVAWSLREADAHMRWTRWQLAGLHTQGQVKNAWEQAATGATGEALQAAAGPGTAPVPATSTALLPVARWQLAFFQEGRWSEVLTSGHQGLRLLLTLPPSFGGGGVLTIDWVDPRVSGHAS